MFKVVLIAILSLTLHGGCNQKLPEPPGSSSNPVASTADVEKLQDCNPSEPYCADDKDCTSFPEVGRKCHTESIDSLIQCTKGYSLVIRESYPAQVGCEWR